MTKNLKNKIEATDISKNSLLKDQKFYIGYDDIDQQLEIILKK